MDGYEVYDIMTGNVYKRFDDIRDADEYIASLCSTELEQGGVQIRPIGLNEHTTMDLI